MKRGQGPTSIFLIILFILIIILVLFFGYKAMTDMAKNAEKTTIMKFQEELKSDVELVKESVGSISFKEYSVPAGLSEVCFVDIKMALPDGIINHPIISDSLKNQEQDSVFLFWSDRLQTFQIEGIELENEPYYSCHQPFAGKVKVSMVGNGNSVLLKASPSKNYCTNAQDADLCEGLDVIFYAGYASGCCKEYKLCC